MILEDLDGNLMVYDFTEFVKKHPGGPKAIIEYAGLFSVINKINNFIIEWPICIKFTCRQEWKLPFQRKKAISLQLRQRQSTPISNRKVVGLKRP